MVTGTSSLARTSQVAFKCHFCGFIIGSPSDLQGLGTPAACWASEDTGAQEPPTFSWL